MRRSAVREGEDVVAGVVIGAEEITLTIPWRALQHPSHPQALIRRRG
jgi:hypothetical protein